MTYTAQQIADYILYYANEHGKSVTNLKLQKLLYFLWIEYFKATGQYLFKDKMYAWKLGPVVPEIYRKYCMYGGFGIMEEGEDSITESDKTCLDNLLSKLIDTDAFDLVEKTHADGKPWKITFNNGYGRNNPINFDLIVELECKE